MQRRGTGAQKEETGPHSLACCPSRTPFNTKAGGAGRRWRGHTEVFNFPVPGGTPCSLYGGLSNNLLCSSFDLMLALVCCGSPTAVSPVLVMPPFPEALPWVTVCPQCLSPQNFSSFQPSPSQLTPLNVTPPPLGRNNSNNRASLEGHHQISTSYGSR